MDAPKHAKIVSLRIIFLATAAVILLALAAYAIYVEFSHETTAQKRTRYQAEAKQAMLDYCTNNIVGFTHAVSVNLDSFGDDIHRWNGEVVAEYVNHLGGVDRTNLSFPFETDSAVEDGHDFVKIDILTKGKRDADAEAKQSELDYQQRIDNLKQ